MKFLAKPGRDYMKGWLKVFFGKVCKALHYTKTFLPALVHVPITSGAGAIRPESSNSHKDEFVPSYVAMERIIQPLSMETSVISARSQFVGAMTLMPEVTSWSPLIVGANHKYLVKQGSSWSWLLAITAIVSPRPTKPRVDVRDYAQASAEVSTVVLQEEDDDMPFSKDVCVAAQAALRQLKGCIKRKPGVATLDFVSEATRTYHLEASLSQDEGQKSDLNLRIVDQSEAAYFYHALAAAEAEVDEDEENEESKPGFSHNVNQFSRNIRRIMSVAADLRKDDMAVFLKKEHRRMRNGLPFLPLADGMVSEELYAFDPDKPAEKVLYPALDVVKGSLSDSESDDVNMSDGEDEFAMQPMLEDGPHIIAGDGRVSEDDDDERE